MKPLPLLIVFLTAIIGFLFWIWMEPNQGPSSLTGEESFSLTQDSLDSPVEGILPALPLSGTAAEVGGRADLEDVTSQQELKQSTDLLLVSESGLPIERVSVQASDGSERTILLDDPGRLSRDWLTPGCRLRALGHVSQEVNGSEVKLLLKPFHEFRIVGYPPALDVPALLGVGDHVLKLESQGQQSGLVDGDWILLTEQNALPFPLFRLMVPNVGRFSLHLELVEGQKGRVQWEEIQAAVAPALPLTFEAVSKELMTGPLEWQVVIQPPKAGQKPSQPSLLAEGSWGTLASIVHSRLKLVSDGETAICSDLPRGWTGRVVVLGEDGHFGWEGPFSNEGGTVRVNLRQAPTVEGHVFLSGAAPPGAEIRLGIESPMGFGISIPFPISSDGKYQRQIPFRPFDLIVMSLEGIPEQVDMSWSCPGFAPVSWVQPWDFNSDTVQLPPATLFPESQLLKVYDATKLDASVGLRGQSGFYSIAVVDRIGPDQVQTLQVEGSPLEALKEPFLVGRSEGKEVYLMRDGDVFRNVPLVPYRLRLSSKTASPYKDAARYVVFGASKFRVENLPVPLSLETEASYEFLAPKESAFLHFDVDDDTPALLPLEPGDNVF
ncbi:MAG: hypothetical protein ACPG31_05355 [Planctomycetota bacterium]